jgi:hypothetical protein
MRLFTDPRLFNYVILALYATNILNYAIRRQWNDAWYWFSAASITASVTFIIGKH